MIYFYGLCYYIYPRHFIKHGGKSFVGTTYYIERETSMFLMIKTYQKRHNGEIIDYDQASACATLAANLSTLSVKLALKLTRPENLQSELTAWFMKKIFKESFNKMIKETECGYGSIATCTDDNCPEGTTIPSYTDDFIEVTEQSLFGGCY